MPIYLLGFATTEVIIVEQPRPHQRDYVTTQGT